MIIAYQIMSGMKRMKESNYFFFSSPLNRQKKVLEMIAGQNKGLTSHKVKLIKR